MLKRLPILCAAAALLVAAGPRAQEASPPSPSELQGDWRNTNNTVHLRVSHCGEAYCGTVIWAIPKAREDAKRGSGRDLIGSQLLSNLTNIGEAKWRGRVFIPDVNSSAAATVTQLNADTLLVSGCIFLGLACKTQHWWRIS